jgi:hypothetical protein
VRKERAMNNGPGMNVRATGGRWVAAALLALGAGSAAQAAPVTPAGKLTQVDVMSGNAVITSVTVPARARLHTRADRVRSASEGGVLVVRMDGQAQVEVRDGDKLLFTLKAEQLVVREAPAGMAAGAGPRPPAAGATFILG